MDKRMDAIFELSRPGVFLNTYERLVSSTKPNSKRCLVATTKRLMDAYAIAQYELFMATAISCKGLKQWVERRKTVRSAKLQIARCRSALITWVEKSLRFFVGAI